MNIRRTDRKVIELGKQSVNAKEAGRLAHNAYLREWRAKNQDKVKKYNEDYWTRKASDNGGQVCSQ